MTVTIANTDNTATFQYWLNRTNEMAEAFRLKVVTVESEPTSGNLSLNGSMEGKNFHIKDNLFGGNIGSVAVLTVGSNIYMTDVGGANPSPNLSIGTSIVNTTINSTAFASGNSTVNGVLYSTLLRIENEQIQTELLPNSLKLGNTTINAVVNSTQFSISNSSTYYHRANSISVSFGNSIANVIANTTSIKIANSIAYANIAPNAIFVGNSIINTIANSTVVKISDGNYIHQTNTSEISFGNSISNVVANISTIEISNSTFVANLTPTSFATGNTTHSANLNVTTLNIKNATNNSELTTTSLKMGSATVNSQISTTELSIKNATANLVANLTSISISNSEFSSNLTPKSFASSNTTHGANLDVTQLNIISPTDNAALTTTSLTLGSATVNSQISTSEISIKNATDNVTITQSSITGRANAELNVINAASLTTTTGVYPTSNSSGTALGQTTRRWVLNANTINASGLITGTSGAAITGTTNTSVAFNVGANVTVDTTRLKIGTSVTNTIITSTSITGNPNTELNVINATSLTATTGVYPTSNSSGNALGESDRRWALNSTTINASGLITGTSGAAITGTTNTSVAFNVGANVTLDTSSLKVSNSLSNVTITNVSIDGNANATLNVVNAANVVASVGVYPSASGKSLGDSSRRWVLNSTTINASGLITGTSGAAITGTTNTSVAFNAGANVTANTTALKVGTATINSVVNSVALKIADTTSNVTITSTAITGNANTEFNNIMSYGYVNAAGLFVYGTNTHIGNNLTADSTLRVDGTANITGKVVIGGDLVIEGDLVYAQTFDGVGDILPASTGFNLGNTTNAWDISAHEITIVSGGKIVPTSSTVGNILGESDKRWALNSTTINASGLITGTSGAAITGTTNTSVAFNVGANVTANTTAVKVGTSTINAVVNSISVTVSGTSSNVRITDSFIYVNEQKTQQEFEVLAATIGTTAQEIDSFSKTLYRSAEYTLSISDTSLVGSNAYQISKAIAIHATNIADINEYGVIYTNNQLGVFSATTNTTHVRVLFTPTVANTSIKGSKKLYGI